MLCNRAVRPPPNRYCCVPGCHSHNGDTTRQISFHRLPQDIKRKNEWLKRIGRSTATPEASTGNLLVCGNHFEPDDFKWTPVRRTLKPSALPRCPLTEATASTLPNCSTKMTTIEIEAQSRLTTDEKRATNRTNGSTNAVKSEVALSCTKRKHVARDPAEKLQSSKMSKMANEIQKSLDKKEAIPGKKLELDYKEPILYDEYLESGIPDSLLEGLGFHSNCEPECDVDEIIPEPPQNSDADLTEIVLDCTTTKTTSLSSSLPSLPLCPRLNMSKIRSNGESAINDKRQATSLEKKSINLLSTDTSRNVWPFTESHHLPINSRRYSSLKQMAPPNSDYDDQSPIDLSNNQVIRSSAAQKTPNVTRGTAVSKRTVTKGVITKGNIIYEHSPTGIVVARLVRKPASPSGGAHSRKQPTPPPPPTVALPSPTTSNSDDFPINESNVEDVLEEMFDATQSMRKQLSSMRDDLRRVGAAISMVTKEQVEKRQEVSRRLTKAYCSYKQTMEHIESYQGRNEDAAA